MRNLYSFLKLKENSSEEEIRISFQNFKKELTKFSPGIEFSNEELRSRQPEVWDAYMALLDPVSKKEHDDLLERDRIHDLYEMKNRAEEMEEGPKRTGSMNYVAMILVILIIGSYFIFAGNKREGQEKAEWKVHKITDTISILLPGKIDTTENILPPFLLHYIKEGTCYKSTLKDGFSVTVARFEMNGNYKISQKDISYIVNVEMSSHMTIVEPDSVHFTMNLHGYNMFVRKGTYSIEGTLHVFENYSMVNGSSAIKVIISYIPGNELQAKYADIVFKSLMS